MSTYSWKGQTALLSIKDSTDTDVPVGVLQDWEVSVEKEIGYLRGSGSSKIQDKQKTETEVSVTGTVMAFDLDTYDTLANYDSANTELDNSADVESFTVTAEVEATGTDKTKKIKVKEVDFSSLPIGGSNDDFIGIDLDGTGTDLELTTV